MWYLLVALLSLNVVYTDDKTWWKYTEVYEIFVPSFQDSNGDGIGDLKGIISRVDHIVDIGVDAVWLTPFFKSPMVDTGYDISNFTDVEPRFGTLQDFEQLSLEFRKRGIKIFIDCVINHSSEEHPWFSLSIKRVKPYDNFYVWKDPKGYSSTGQPLPPNNWLSLFGGSAWEWNEERKQFYLHQFGKQQPDFNLRDRNLREEIKKILKFWFDRGITGLRMDAIIQYIEDSQFRDEPLLHPEIKKEKYTWQDYDHIYTSNNWETYELTHELRQFIDKINRKEGGPERVIICEAYTDMNHTMAFYGTKDYPIAHFPFNFWLIPPEKYRNASSTQKFVDYWIHDLPETGVPNWVGETHDTIRIATELQSQEFTYILTFLIMTLPGVACLYYGQEIGMPAGPVREDQLRDYLRGLDRSRISRDPLRLPMQWDDTLNSGYSSTRKTWLPVNPNYWRFNVAAQKSDKNSFLNVFKRLSKLRKTKIGKYGNFQSYVLSTWVFAFTRTFNHETNLVLFNLGTEMELINLKTEIKYLPPTMKVFTGTPNSGYMKGTIVKINSKFPEVLILKPVSAVLLTTNLKDVLTEDVEE